MDDTLWIDDRVTAHVRLRIGPESGIGLTQATRTPQGIRGDVVLVNRSDAPARVPVRGCTVYWRAYRPEGADRPVFDPHAGGGCVQAPYEVEIAPGESETLSSYRDASNLLTESRPGPYRFGVLLRLADRTVELPAGIAEVRSGTEDLEIEVRTRTVADSVRAVATVRNPTDEHVFLQYGACALRLRVYRTADRGDEPVWRSEYRSPAHACPLYLSMYTLDSGESFSPGEFSVRIPRPAIQGDSLPAGRYWLGAVLDLNHHAQPEVAAGQTRLRPDRRR